MLNIFLSVTDHFHLKRLYVIFQLRIQTGTIGPSGHCTSAKPHPGRQSLGSRYGPREVLEPGESRQADALSEATDRRSASAETHQRIPQRGNDMRPGGAFARTYAAGRITIPAVGKSVAGRP